MVREKNAVLIHRFGKYNKTCAPGVNWKIPFVDQVEYVHDLREQVVDIQTQVAVTKDNVALHIDGILYIQIEDPYKASYNVENIYSAIINLAQTTMRSEIGKLSLDKTFEEREVLNEKIIASIDHETSVWGVKAIRYEIKDIEPPQNIQNSMILQAEAERKKRASILTSEGERAANINIAEAEKISQVLKAEGIAEQQIQKARAQADALNKIDASLKRDQGEQAAQFLLAMKYMEAYKKIANENNTLVLQHEPQNVKKMVQEARESF